MEETYLPEKISTNPVWIRALQRLHSAVQEGEGGHGDRSGTEQGVERKRGREYPRRASISFLTTPPLGSQEDLSPRGRISPLPLVPDAAVAAVYTPSTRMEEGGQQVLRSPLRKCKVGGQ